MLQEEGRRIKKIKKVRNVFEQEKESFIQPVITVKQLPKSRKKRVFQIFQNHNQLFFVE